MHATRYCNNVIYLESNRKINQDDLELIVLFFENTKLTGGYDIFKYELIEPTILRLNYKYNESKQEILKRSTFIFEKYEFKVKEILNAQQDPNKVSKKINNMLIFTNINVENVEILELYVGFLIQSEETQNLIDKIDKSILFQDTYYVYFKQEINFGKILKRLAKKPKLRNQQVFVYEAYEVNQLLLTVLPNNGSIINLNDFEDFFDKKLANIEKERFYELPLVKNSSYLFVHFKNYNQLTKFTNKKYTIPNLGDLVYENCFNYEFLDMVISNYFKNLIDKKNNDGTHVKLKTEPTEKNDESVELKGSTCHDSDSDVILIEDDANESTDKSVGEEENYCVTCPTSAKLEDVDPTGKKRTNDSVDDSKTSEAKISRMDETLTEPTFDNGKSGLCVGFTGCFGFIKCESFDEDLWFHKNRLVDFECQLSSKDRKKLELIGKRMNFDIAYNYEGRKMQAIRITDENGNSFFNQNEVKSIKQKPKEELKFNTSDYKWCHYCYIKFHNQKLRDEHFDSDEHQRRVSLQITNKKLFCRICYKQYTHANLLKKHETGTFHRQYLNQYRNYQKRKIPKIELRQCSSQNEAIIKSEDKEVLK